MDVLDKTTELAISIRESAEYTDFMTTKAEVEMSPDASAILREYRARQFALELAEIAGDGVDEINNALAEICDRMEEDELCSRYLDAEYNLICLVRNIQDIFSEQLGITFETAATAMHQAAEPGGLLN